jgi:crotonobetainyl-CoA:carnitine CoA-transferase CaiB-like acyl-CoA transferase
MDSAAMTDDPPFEGVRVLDLSQGIAGPYCGMMLARNGADVIKLEPTGTGCWSRQLGKATGDHTAHSLIVHRGKRSLSLDLKSPEGCAIARRLAADCDVLIQNYRVGKIDRFGLDYDTVRQANEAIVYLSITGFGSSGPNADLPATDSVMQAYTGLMSINRDATGMPQRLNMLAIDFACGLYGFQAVSSALYRKAMKGKGAHIQTSLLEASLSYQEAAIVESALQGAEVEPIGMPVGTFKTSDGYMSINARRQPQFERFARLLGHEEWIGDPRFVEPRARVANREALLALLRPIIETKTTDEWCALLSEIDVLHGRVHTHGDLFEDSQVKAISALRWVDDPTLGTVPMASLPGQPTPMTGDRFTLSPRLGEHTREILAELGHEAAAIEAMIAGGAAQAAD